MMNPNQPQPQWQPQAPQPQQWQQPQAPQPQQWQQPQPQQWQQPQPQQWQQPQAPQPQQWQQPQQPQAIDPRLVFTGIEQARAAGNQNFVRCGKYAWRTDNVRIASDNTGGLHVVFELTCLYCDANNQAMYQQSGGQDIWRPHTAGEQAVYMISKKHQGYLGNLKAVFGTLLGVNPDTLTLDMCVQVITGNLLVGVAFEASGLPQVTRAGKTITKFRAERSLPFAMVKQMLDAQGLTARIYGAGVLEQLIAAEQNAGLGQPPQAPSAGPQAPQAPQQWQAPSAGPPAAPGVAQVQHVAWTPGT